jgi:ankyrin repeat protein
MRMRLKVNESQSHPLTNRARCKFLHTSEQICIFPPRRLSQDAQRRDGEGDTLLHNAVVDGDMDAVRTLLDARADPCAKNRAGITCPHISTRQ